MVLIMTEQFQSIKTKLHSFFVFNSNCFEHRFILLSGKATLTNLKTKNKINEALLVK